MRRALLLWSALAALACDGSGPAGGPIADTTRAADTTTDVMAADVIAGDDDASGEDAFEPPSDVSADVSTDIAEDTWVPPAEPAWRPLPLGASGDLHGARFLGEAGFRLAGHRGTLLRRLGSGWVREWTPFGTADLHDLARADDALHAVGDGGGWLTRQVDGRWLQWSVELQADLRGVAALGADLLAAGRRGAIVRRSGDTLAWEHSQPDGPDLHAIAVSGVEGFAVGGQGTVLRRVQGDTGPHWVRDNAVTTEADLHDVWVLAPLNLWVVGDAGTVWHFTGGWAAETAPADRALSGVTGGAGQVMAVGAAGAFLERTADALWPAAKDVEGPLMAHLDYRAVALGGDQAVAAGEAGALQQKHLPDGPWTDAAAAPLGGIERLASTGDTVAGVGSNGLLVVLDGAGYGAVDSGTGADLHAVAVADDGVVWAAGDGGALVRSAPGQLPQVFDAGAAHDLRGLALHGGVVHALARGGALASLPAGGGAITAGYTGHAGVYRALIHDGQGLVAVGHGGLMVRHGGAGWTKVALGTGADLHGADARDGQAIAVGAAGTVVVWADGGTPEVTSGAATTLYRDVALDGTGGAWLVGWAGALHRRHADGTISVEPSPTAAPLSGVALWGEAPVIGGSTPRLWAWLESDP